MSDAPTILVINPGSTSTRIALYDGEQLVDDEHLVCDADELAACEHVIDQKDLRDRQVTALLEKLGRSVSDLDAVAARGGGGDDAGVHSVYDSACGGACAPGPPISLCNQSEQNTGSRSTFRTPFTSGIILHCWVIVEKYGNPESMKNGGKTYEERMKNWRNRRILHSSVVYPHLRKNDGSV